MFPPLKKALTWNALKNYVTNEKNRKRTTAENCNRNSMEYKQDINPPL